MASSCRERRAASPGERLLTCIATRGSSRTDGGALRTLSHGAGPAARPDLRTPQRWFTDSSCNSPGTRLGSFNPVSSALALDRITLGKRIQMLGLAVEGPTCEAVSGTAGEKALGPLGTSAEALCICVASL
ncbi:hypothetical protein SKAU_G00045840 [Synaphobranchus kaupii]|uniref:Uncharacterized protein n=1 Tax=Synaphobranchus kaupii TaxID=118154 RepID=A0A9Q1G321_SYNKA|nr:hypothetical protein SKAU_G00045840 [Synaphobranchus kaupii]